MIFNGLKMLQQVFFIFVFLYLTVNKSILDIQVEAVFPSATMAKTRRTQSVNIPYKNGQNIYTHSRSLTSISSRSSDSSSSLIKESESQPIASTSLRKHDERMSFKEVDPRPIVEKKHVNFETVNLNEASVATHSTDHINPARDGVFARVRKALLLYGSAVAVGTGISVGGSAINQHFFRNGTQMIPTNTTSEHNIINEIVDAI